jgi:hypothetical protein
MNNPDKKHPNNIPLTLPENWNKLVERWLSEPDDFHPAGYCPPLSKAPPHLRKSSPKKKSQTIHRKPSST